MNIVFRCYKCNKEYKIAEENLKDNLQSMRFCECGGKLSIANVEEIVGQDIETTVRSNINLWFKELGIEYTIELCEKHKQKEVRKLYIKEIQRRGFMTRGEIYEP
jgi:hypothetical protein